MTNAQSQADANVATADYGQVIPIKKFSRKKDEGLWLMSFSDMSMILISFFILQLSFSTVNQQKADVLREAVQTNKFEAKKDSMTAVSKRIDNEIKRLNLDKNAQVTMDTSGVVVEFKDGLLFSAGSAEGNQQFSGIVGQVMKVIASSPDRYKIKIEGHTDDVPIKSQKFASNWELSASRGIYLMRQFAARGVREDRMSVLALAHTQPKKSVLGLLGKDLELSRAANRRVVIRLEASESP
jgi:chemotaxis protein MotB